MHDRFLTEAARRDIERLEFWVAAVRSCAIALVIVVGLGGVIALGPMLLRAAT